ncbi:TPA: hypothetical protein HNO48_25980, partial [Escherichia coli]|nr:hypothetical protein [Escherichia coli]
PEIPANHRKMKENFPDVTPEQKYYGTMQKTSRKSFAKTWQESALMKALMSLRKKAQSTNREHHDEEVNIPRSQVVLQAEVVPLQKNNPPHYALLPGY